LGRGLLGATAVLFAAGSTPLLLFVSTTNTLYLKNAHDLGNDLGVLRQFWGAAVWTFAFGLIIVLLARYFRSKLLAFLFWAYGLLGPFFIAYAFLHVRYRQTMDSFLVCAAFVAGWLLAAAVLTMKGKVGVGHRVFARVFLCFVVVEGAIIATHRGTREPVAVQASSQVHEKGQTRLPNIYHIVLDMFQTDLFEFARTRGAEEHLAGFTYYPENTAAYQWTVMSIPSVFLGDYCPSLKFPDGQYEWDAFNSPKSFVHGLVESGYETYGLTLSTFPAERFQHAIAADAAYCAEKSFTRSNSALFRSLWAFTYLPGAIGRRCAYADDIAALATGKPILPASGVATSHAALLRFLQEEADLPEHNRYTFLHVLMPHFPFVITKDGLLAPQLENGAFTETSLEEQVLGTTCLMIQIIQKLKELGRFEDALILIHADHGYRYYLDLETGKPKALRGFSQVEEARAYSRALLLLKLPGRDAREPLLVSRAEASLIDIAPTILDAVGVRSEHEYAGFSLVDPANVRADRERRFIMHDLSVPYAGLSPDIWTIRNGEYSKTGPEGIGSIVRYERAQTEK